MTTNKARLAELEKAAQAQGKVITVWDDEPTVIIDGQELPIDEARRRYPPQQHTWIYVTYSGEVNHAQP